MMVTSDTLSDKPDRFTKWLTGVALGAGLFSSVLGLTVLVGWRMHNVTLIQVFPAFVPMQFNTALGFVLCGLALLLAMRDRPRLAAAAGTMAAAIGILTLVEYVFSVSLGIDELLQEHYITVETSHSGRMAPNTAICFALIGLALLSRVVLPRAIAGRWLNRSLVPVILGSLALGLGTVALSGYLTEIETAYGWGRLTRMAIHTAAGFIALGMGMACLIWRRDLSREAALPRWFPVPICVGVLTATVCFWQALEAEFAKMGEAGVLPQGRSYIPQALLVVGILLALAMALAAYLAQTALRKAVQVESARLVLAGEIAERKQAEEALRESESRLREAQRMAQLGRWCWDVKTGNVEWSEEVYKIFRLNPEEFTPQIDSILALSPLPEDYERDKELIQRAMESREQGSYEQRFLRPDGSTGCYLSTFQGIYDNDGELTAIKGTAQDITERKRGEKEREDLITKLEAQNAELERFTYTVSHDLKSPLITIKGYVGMLRQDLADGNPEPVEDDLARISSAVDKMDQLLRELLELSRIGRSVNPPEAMPLEGLAREAIELVGEQVKEKGVQIEISPDLPVVFGDRIRLREVLQNLIDNAVKYMGDQSRPRVEIGSRRDGNQTICHVRDNGIGIDPRYHEKIFGLFNQLDQKAAGSGIGLSLVKRIVEVHGGRTWVESDGARRGSTFCFTLPLCPPSDTSGTANQLTASR